MDHTLNQKQPATFTDILRVRFKNVLDPIGAFLNKIGVTPNMITMLGLTGNVLAALLIARGQIVWGGVVVLLMGPLDAVDGTMARLRGAPTRFGGVLDSVVDRYSELLILGGLLIYFTGLQDSLSILLTYLAAAGSVLVSYVKSRAETAGFFIKGGLLTRVERYIITALFLLLNQPMIVIWVLAVLANFTAFQRMWLVRKMAVEQKDLIS